MKIHKEEALHAISNAETVLLGLQMRLQKLENTKSANYLERIFELLGQAKDEIIANEE